jgi:predicted HAD superfamily hydrolase
MKGTRKVFSFDVFDTVITRCYSRPTDLFYSVGQELFKRQFISITPEAWTTLRIIAEENTRKSSDQEEITLSEIYAYISVVLNVEGGVQEQMQHIEMERELACFSPIQTNKDLIDSLRQKGQQVIFISDMYLPKDLIQTALRKNGIECHDNDLYVSCEHRLTKHTANLFKKVLRDFDIAPQNLIHTGDNIYSDYEVPRKLGIDAKHFNRIQFTKREKLIADTEVLPAELRSFVASASRLTRLNNHHNDFHKDQVVNISATVIGPVLFGFTLWTLLEAKRRGINRLYYISRDGQILLKIAQIINNTLELGIECRYFYGSRQAFHLPATRVEDIRNLDWVYDNTSFLSVDSIFARVDLNPEIVSDELINAGFERQNWNQNLGEQDRIRLRETLTGSAAFESHVIEKAADARKTLIAYLKQEGIDKNSKIAFVDIGWNGRLQRSLSRVMASAGLRPEGGLTGLYFGLRQRLRAFDDDTMLAYYYDFDNGLTRYNDVAILEKFVEATHGSVTKYKFENGNVVPVLKEIKNQAALNWGLELQQKATVDFTTIVCSYLNKLDTKELNDPENWVQLSEILLSDFCKSPTKPESIVFGSLTISEDQNHSKVYKLAKPLSVRNCISLLLRQKPKVYNDLWISGSLHITPFGNLVSACLKTQNRLISFVKTGLLRKAG